MVFQYYNVDLFPIYPFLLLVNFILDKFCTYRTPHYELYGIVILETILFFYFL